MKEKLKELRSKLVEIHHEIFNIQDTCKHSNLIGKYKCDTGNWDSSNDHYWVVLSCLDCDKTWEEDQNQLRYDRVLDTKVTKDGIPFIVV